MNLEISEQTSEKGLGEVRSVEGQGLRSLSRREVRTVVRPLQAALATSAGGGAGSSLDIRPLPVQSPSVHTCPLAVTHSSQSLSPPYLHSLISGVLPPVWLWPCLPDVSSPICPDISLHPSVHRNWILLECTPHNIPRLYPS